MIEERFQVVDSNSVKLPGSCLICGYGEDARPFVDLGVQVKRYGRLYFCVVCFRECEKIVNDTIGYPANSGPTSVRANVSNDPSGKEVIKRSPGRPKKADTGTSKPNPK